MTNNLSPLTAKQIGKQILSIALGLAILLGVVGLLLAATQRVIAMESPVIRAFAGIVDVVFGTFSLLLAIYFTVRTFVFLTSTPG